MSGKAKRIATLGTAAALAVAAQAGQAQSTGGEGYGNFVWNDLNQNGVQDAGEAGVANVLVSLFSNVDGFTTAIDTSTTDAGGNYFLNIGSRASSFQYIIQFSLPTGFQFTVADQGGDDAFDSDVTNSNGRTDTRFGFNLPFSGGPDLTVDAGVFAVQTTPEPATLALVSLGLGLAGFSVRVRRR